MRLLTKKDRAFWVEIEDAEVLIKPLTAAEVERIRRKHTKISFVRGERVEETDWGKVTQDMFCACVRDWKGICDEEGNPIACTEENKRLVAELNTGFAGEVIQRATALEQYLNSEEIKNLSGGQGGTSTPAQ